MSEPGPPPWGSPARRPVPAASPRRTSFRRSRRRRAASGFPRRRPGTARWRRRGVDLSPVRRTTPRSRCRRPRVDRGRWVSRLGLGRRLEGGEALPAPFGVRQRRARRSPGSVPVGRIGSIDARVPPTPERTERSVLARPLPGASPRACRRSRARCGRGAPARGPPPHRRGALGVGQQRRDRVRDRPPRPCRRPGCRSRRPRAPPGAAGVPDDDGPPARGRLDEHVAPPFHLHTGQARAARHREHVARARSSEGDRPRAPGRERPRSRRSLGRERPEAGPRTVRRPRSPASRRGPDGGYAMPRISTSCPLRATSRLTQTTTGRSPTPRRSRRSPSGDRGGTAHVGARIQDRDRHAPRHGGAHGPGDEGAAHHRHPRGPRRRVAHRGMRARRDREPVLEPVSRGEVRRSRPARGAARASPGGRWRRTAPPPRRLSRRRRRAAPRRGRGPEEPRFGAARGTGLPRRTPRRPPRRRPDRTPRSGLGQLAARAPRGCAGSPPRVAGSRS